MLPIKKAKFYIEDMTLKTGNRALHEYCAIADLNCTNCTIAQSVAAALCRHMATS